MADSFAIQREYLEAHPHDVPVADAHAREMQANEDAISAGLLQSDDDDHHDEVALVQYALDHDHDHDHQLTGNGDDHDREDDEEGRTTTTTTITGDNARRRTLPKVAAAGDFALTNSNTEGCFLVTPPHNVSRESLGGPISTTKDGAHASLRADAFERACSALDRIVRAAQGSLLRIALSGIVNFLLGHDNDEQQRDENYRGDDENDNNNNDDDDDDNDDNMGEVRQLLAEFEMLGTETPEIPTAMVVMGVNQIDHNSVFELLQEKLRRDDDEAVARVVVVRLRAKDYPTTTTTRRNYALTAILEQLDEHLARAATTTAAAAAAATTTTTTTTSSSSSSTTAKPTSMRDIWSKYQALPLESRPTPLLLVFEDAECFSTETLQLLIDVCSGEYMARLPFVFLFGIATSSEQLYDLLPPSSLAKLRIEHFTLVVARELVRNVLYSMLSLSLSLSALVLV